MARMTFTTARMTPVDPAALLAAIRTATGDPGALLWLLDPSRIAVDKSTTFSAQDVADVQAALDAVAAITPQRDAQNAVDSWPIVWKALALTLLDQINVLRTNAGLATVTPAQALAAIRAKAATL